MDSEVLDSRNRAHQAFGIIGAEWSMPYSNDLYGNAASCFYGNGITACQYRRFVNGDLGLVSDWVPVSQHASSHTASSPGASFSDSVSIAASASGCCSVAPKTVSAGTPPSNRAFSAFFGGGACESASAGTASTFSSMASSDSSTASSAISNTYSSGAFSSTYNGTGTGSTSSTGATSASFAGTSNSTYENDAATYDNSALLDVLRKSTRQARRDRRSESSVGSINNDSFFQEDDRAFDDDWVSDSLMQSARSTYDGQVSVANLSRTARIARRKT